MGGSSRDRADDAASVNGRTSSTVLYRRFIGRDNQWANVAGTLRVPSADNDLTPRCYGTRSVPTTFMPTLTNSATSAYKWWSPVSFMIEAMPATLKAVTL